MRGTKLPRIPAVSDAIIFWTGAAWAPEWVRAAWRIDNTIWRLRYYLQQANCETTALYNRNLFLYNNLGYKNYSPYAAASSITQQLRQQTLYHGIVQLVRIIIIYKITTTEKTNAQHRAKCQETNELMNDVLTRGLYTNIHTYIQYHTHARAFSVVKHKDLYSTCKRTTDVNYLFTTWKRPTFVDTHAVWNFFRFYLTQPIHDSPRILTADFF